MGKVGGADFQTRETGGGVVGSGSAWQITGHRLFARGLPGARGPAWRLAQDVSNEFPRADSQQAGPRIAERMGHRDNGAKSDMEGAGADL